MATPVKDATTKTIELLRAHEHGGREYPPGAELTLPADAADWLVGIKAAKPVEKK